MKRNRANQKGFTIVELLIATTVFSIILLVISSGIIQIGRFYYKNITSARTQEATRNIVEEVVRTAQFSDSVVKQSSNLANPAYCIGESRYSFVINRQVGDGPGDTPVALWNDRQDGEDCVGLNLLGALPTGNDLLSENMRLLHFEVREEPNDNVYVKVRVAYGDNDLLTNYPVNATATTPPNGDAATATCRSGIAGSSFCSVSELETTVKRR